MRRRTSSSRRCVSSDAISALCSAGSRILGGKQRRERKRREVSGGRIRRESGGVAGKGAPGVGLALS
jgi:hypothetical protein